MLDQRMQKDLNYTLTKCDIQENELLACGYHENRAKSIPFGIESNAIKVVSKYVGFLTPTRDIKSIAKLFEQNKNPAGGWYLVKEQREWLRKNLYNILLGKANHEKYQDSPIRILEAGVASFVHHYTYLRIISDVLNEIDRNLRVSLIVVDKCIYPIVQIAAIERELADAIKKPKRIDLGNSLSIEISKEFLSIMSLEHRMFGNINTELWVGDLTKHIEVGGLGAVDIITEHFLTSVFDKRIRENEISLTRKTYGKTLKPDGYLLTANGLTSGSPSYENFIKLHSVNNLMEIPERTETVWDPYGLKRESLIALLYQEKEIQVLLDNTMSVFQKVQP